MKIFWSFPVFVLCLAATSSGQESAKSLFQDPAFAKPVVAPAATQVVPHKTGIKPSAVQVRAQSVVSPAITGLRYWIELRTGRNELVEARPGTVFHSGDRIRLHATSNVNGRLTIMQSEDGAPFKMLFPTGSSPDNRVQRLEERVLPSERSWFKFDNRPGQLRLMMMVTADRLSPSPSSPDSATEHDGNSGKPLVPDDGVSEIASAATIRRTIEMQKGSKALVVEDDEPVSSEPANYVVVDARKDNSLAGAVAVEILLDHRPR